MRGDDYVLTREENEFLTRVGPGTPCGELMRKYWHPVLPTEHLVQNPVRPVRLLGENFVVYRDRSGTLGMLGERCPHRLVRLELGIPEEKGLRCPYHGWLFDNDGTCLQMPLEPPDTSLRKRVKAKSYPVQEMGGLIWAYIGSDEAPLLPKWDLFIREKGFRQIVGHQLPCNWLQAQENRGDLGHAAYLHGRNFQYVLERRGKLTDDPDAFYNVQMKRHQDQLDRGVYTKYRAVYNEFGFTKGTMDSDGDPTNPSWTIGNNPILFPYLLAFGPFDGIIRQTYQLGVPIDDTKTWHLEYALYTFPDEIDVPEQAVVPYTAAPLLDEQGELIRDYVLAQDMMAWHSQGPITERWNETLGVSDHDVIAYRRLLRREIEKVQRGEEPMNRFWDEESATSPELRIPGFDGKTADLYRTRQEAASLKRENLHKISGAGWPYLDDEVDRVMRDRDLLLKLYKKTAELRDA
jgi:5,5'-dehydrodivanillate O-demethylase oxygenase subunit